MKSIAELEAVQKKTLASANLGDDRAGARVVVGLATCGIAAGAKPVLDALVDEVGKRGLAGVTVVQTGCIGMCRLEPIVEVTCPGRQKMTYVKVTPDMASRIVGEHIVGGTPVAEFTIGAAEA